MKIGDRVVLDVLSDIDGLAGEICELYKLEGGYDCCVKMDCGVHHPCYFSELKLEKLEQTHD